MSRMRLGSGVDEAWFPGIFRQFRGYGVQPFPGCDRHFWAVFGTQCVGHLQDATGTYPNFHVMSGTRPGHGRTEPDFQFVGTMCWPSPGCILAAAGTQPDFQAFLGNFWDSVCKPSSGRVMATAMTQPDLQAILGSFWVIGFRVFFKINLNEK
ncbi:Hypothetical predicted protein [Olea europaea subsp. europaea]|uniref:Uncharacterized protein n=1 Tax=Olea europaea subsp. europaea TaxID=158383 RepID=A0A8S0PNI0_OLEEU|nr:Hypothetical predicted protein [Olea europaea subsp. europaea]